MLDKRRTRVIYPITIGDLQDEAIRRIGRKLTDSELDTAIGCVESGISFVVDITLKAAIEQAVLSNSTIDEPIKVCV